MTERRQLVEFTIVVRPRQDSISAIPLGSFASLLSDIVSIHDTLSKLVYPSLENISPLTVIQMNMNSPAWLKLISFKDIAEAISKLLGIPQELKEKSLRIEKSRQENEQLKQEIETQKQSNQLSQQEAVQRSQFLDERIKQERILTLDLVQHHLVEATRRLAELSAEYPSADQQFLPKAHSIIMFRMLSIATGNDLEVEVTNIQPQNREPLESTEEQKRLPSATPDNQNKSSVDE